MSKTENLSEYFKDAKVLVTGGAGFIGSHLAKRLAKIGAKVTVVDDLSAIKISNLDSNKHSGIRLIANDLRNKSIAEKVCKEQQYIFHLAADMGGMSYINDNMDVFQNNMLININMCNAAINSDRFLYTSSACVYPEFKQNTPDITPLKETDAYPALPDTPYGWEKLLSEMMFMN